ncbi:Tim44 domain-containing protein [Janthinobacterium agaricidamnosum]|uniref:Tim44-like domain protein n=1 Tax=Janthinobacterium agaricidamnosum NBRC 102515 = DSM 9628 TaxID=1349767 RepID=W0VDU7_9BURK|nr:Tim44-like domain-containing protein [Janthinobacterium agaricidamnosum]CDG85457.1 tim44-like domain protein [Janthinobacterium agaricidamnosum NBRC 102515 = DSM 9628]
MKMKKFLVCLMLAVTTMSMLSEASARRVGGGGSFGRQSQNVSRQPHAPAPAPAPRQAQPAPAPAPAPAAAPKAPSRWKGILGGALLGLGLGALLSHFGLGGAFASMIGSLLMIALLALAAFFIYRLVRGKAAANSGNSTPFSGFGGNNPQPQGAGNYGNSSNVPEIGSRLQPQAFQPAASTSGVTLDKPAANAQWGVPADFDSVAFLRHAKSNFIRLQAAWDKADVNDIREFTTPEVYAELKMQIQERGANTDFTDVVTIDAELLGIETGATDYLASVKFTGQIRSAPNAAPEPFSEVWNMSKPLSGNTGWVLAGIQQLA